MVETMVNYRGVASVVQAVATLEGEGVAIRRVFPTPALDYLDPFLLLDEMGPSDLKPREAKGFPDHPHRGFETVTYVLEGKMEHRDSHGHQGSIGPGDVQWMTAGSGVVHSEMPASEIMQSGGRLHGFQLWVNLPGRDKMMDPRYQELPGAGIPAAESPTGDVKVRIIAGDALGKQARIQTRTPIEYLHFTLAPGAEHVQPVPKTFNAFAYVIDGEATFGPDSRRVTSGQMAIFLKDADAVRISATRPLSVLLVAGEPIGEPVARAGPFVMNTREEIYQAFRDYQNGKMGQIAR